jgi:hypothetical protein
VLGDGRPADRLGCSQGPRGEVADGEGFEHSSTQWVSDGVEDVAVGRCAATGDPGGGLWHGEIICKRNLTCQLRPRTSSMALLP